MSYTTYLAGDYTSDAVVDGADFLAWQRSYGFVADPVGSGADGSYDGLVNAADLTVWQTYFGVALPSPSTLQAVAVANQSAPLSASLLADEEIDSPNSLPALDSAFASVAGWRAEQSLRRIAPDVSLRRSAIHEVTPRQRESIAGDPLTGFSHARRWTIRELSAGPRCETQDALDATDEPFRDFDAALESLASM
jgi:hypothetical protein